MRAKGLNYAVPVLAFAVLSLAVVPGAFASASHPSTSVAGLVFLQTNSASGNAIVTYARSSSGALTWVANYSSGGNGTGSDQTAQGSVVLSANNEWLLAVDAGSNQISVFKVQTSSTPYLTLTDTVASGGVLPVSLAVHGSLVFVLNDGSASTPGMITGFHLSSTGRLSPIAGSTELLSTKNATSAEQIGFNPAGHVLVVTEKGTGLIDLFHVSPTGRTQAAVSYSSVGNGPYGFAFDNRGYLIVSEAASGSLSSYSVSAPSALATLSGAVPDYQAAPCWVAVTPGPRGTSWAFTTDAHGATISSYQLGVGGKLTLIQSDAATTGAADTDEAIVPSIGVLYVYDAGSNEVQGFGIGAGASLTWLQNSTGLVASAEGLAAF
ncbi:MAG TPA: beta-propeller fold lactonase family protein [Thermoplasmata archaeon]|nr:beta-propeller fold lactonase family protein [Thermoplasmata archaeon]